MEMPTIPPSMILLGTRKISKPTETIAAPMVMKIDLRSNFNFLIWLCCGCCLAAVVPVFMSKIPPRSLYVILQAQTLRSTHR